MHLPLHYIYQMSRTLLRTVFPPPRSHGTVFSDRPVAVEMVHVSSRMTAPDLLPLAPPKVAITRAIRTADGPALRQAICKPGGSHSQQRRCCNPRRSVSAGTCNRACRTSDDWTAAGGHQARASLGSTWRRG